MHVHSACIDKVGPDSVPYLIERSDNQRAHFSFKPTEETMSPQLRRQALPQVAPQASMEDS